MPAVANAIAGDFPSAPALVRETFPRANIRVLIADLHTVAMTHVRAMMAGAGDVTVVAESAPSHSAALAARLAPDVIITELAAPVAPGIATIRALARATTNARVLVVSTRPETEWLLEALDAGAAGVVSSHATRDEVLIAVHAVMNGQIVLDRCAISALMSRSRYEPPPSTSATSDSKRMLGRLTGREQSVFRLIAEGYSAPEIGLRLSISKKTVETYKKRIGEKLGFSHRAEYVRFALQVAILAAPRMAIEE